MRKAGILALALLAALTARGADTWIKLKSGNFDLYTNASDKRGRELLTQFERIRSFFDKDLHRDAKPMLPARIVVFKTAKEFNSYRPSETAAAFYQKGVEAHYIAMQASGEEHVAYHEFIHLLVAHLDLKLPAWLGEGLAEFYATLKPVGGKLQVGEPIASHFYVHQQSKWIPLAQLLAADHDSPLYNRKAHAGAFYAESWALTHMLSLAKEYRPKFAEFNLAILNGASSEEAFRNVYKKETVQVEKDLQAYFRSNSFFSAIFDETLPKKFDATPAESPEKLELGIVLANLLPLPARRPRYEALVAEFPDRAEPYAGLGYLSWMERDNAGARKHFADAFTRGSDNPEMLWDLVRLTQGSDPKTSTSAAEKLLKLNPQHTDARIYLAYQYLQAGKHGGAYSLLSPIKSVKPEQARPFFTALAHSLDRLGELERAQDAAKNLLKLKGTPDEDRQARQLADYLDQRVQEKKTAVAPAADNSSRVPFAGDPSPRTTSRRYTQPGGELVEETIDVQRSPHGDALEQIEGKFVQLECLGTEAKVVVQNASKTIGLLITEPNNLVVTASGEGRRMDLQCGPQTPAPAIKVWFVPKPDPKRNAAGVLWRIEFR